MQQATIKKLMISVELEDMIVASGGHEEPRKNSD